MTANLWVFRLGKAKKVMVFLKIYTGERRTFLSGTRVLSELKGEKGDEVALQLFEASGIVFFCRWLTDEATAKGQKMMMDVLFNTFLLVTDDSGGFRSLVIYECCKNIVIYISIGSPINVYAYLSMYLYISPSRVYALTETKPRGSTFGL